jgi:hypothetical protein
VSGAGGGTPHIWAHGASAAAFERARPLLDGLRAEHSRYRLLLTARRAATRRALRAAFPRDTVEPPPRGGDWRVRRAIGRLRPHALLLLDGSGDLGAAVFRRAGWWRFPVILIADDAAALAATRASLLAAVDHVVVADAREAALVRARGLRPEQVGVPAPPGGLRTEEAAAGSAGDPRLAVLRPLLRRDWAALGTPPPRGLPGAFRRLLGSPPGRLVLRARTRRLDSLDAVRAALGRCDAILCLGNGPSSEDPRLAALAVDCVFRVNCSWLARSWSTHPQAVFVGDARCLRRVAGALFAFRTIEEETRLLGHYLLRGRLRRVPYLTVERLPVSINERRWPARPTNGATMIATAAALEPRRLVIAGMDLFQHPAGAYPGDPATPNDYLVMHDRATELAVVDLALRRFRGEVTVLSDALSRGLAARRCAAAAPGPGA